MHPPSGSAPNTPKGRHTLSRVVPPICPSTHGKAQISKSSPILSSLGISMILPAATAGDFSVFIVALDLAFFCPLDSWPASSTRFPPVEGSPTTLVVTGSFVQQSIQRWFGLPQRMHLSSFLLSSWSVSEIHFSISSRFFGALELEDLEVLPGCCRPPPLSLPLPFGASSASLPLLCCVWA